MSADHEHTPPTEAKLDEWKQDARENIAMIDKEFPDATSMRQFDEMTLRLIAEVRRLRADSELASYVLANGIIATNEDNDLCLIVDLMLAGAARYTKWSEGECGLAAEEAQEVNGDGLVGHVSGAVAIRRIIGAVIEHDRAVKAEIDAIDAARQEPTP